METNKKYENDVDCMISIHNLSFAYKGSQTPVLKDIQYSQQKGTFNVIMGPSGAGKTTLLRALSGQIPHFYKGKLAGEISIAGKNPLNCRLQELADTVGMVFQNFETQLFCTEATLDVAFGPGNLVLPHEELQSRVKNSLEEVGLYELRGRNPGTLSGGEKQRLALASILALNPQVLVLDEPSTDLDPQGKQELFKLLSRLKTKGMTIIAVEHESEAILQADELVIVADGHVVERGHPHEMIMKIDILRKNNISVPDLACIEAHCTIKKYEGNVLEAKKLLDEKHFVFDEKRYSKLLFADQKRKHLYGKELIHLGNVSYGYSATTKALQHCSLRIREGEFLAILGMNGSGKTTLLKHLIGLLHPGEGRIKIKNKDLTKMRIADIGRIVGFVFQDPDYQIFSSTVYDEVAFAPKNFGLGPLLIGQRVEKSLKVVGLWEKRDQDPFILTKGERQRLALASVLSAKPEIIVFDEPTTGLDAHEIEQVMQLLLDLNRNGHTIIMVTHTQWIVNRYAHRVIVMNKGSIVCDEQTRKLYKHAAVLQKADICIPDLIQFGQLYGKVFLSANEVYSCLATVEEIQASGLTIEEQLKQKEFNI